MKNIQADIVVPVFNEEEGLMEFYQRICALDVSVNLIFIDNASTDRSLSIMKTFSDVQIIEHKKNEGYGASLRDGMRRAASDKIIIIDADCEYPPEAIPELITELDHNAIVYTSRFLDDRNKGMGFLKATGNKIISQLFNILYGQNVTDLYTGSKGFRRDIVQEIKMERNGFEHVLEIAARLAKKGYNIKEIPVDFRARQTGNSKMSHLSETIKYLFLLIYYYLTIPPENK